MTRPEHLASLIQGIAAPAAREISKAVLRTFTEAEYIEWNLLQNAARQARFRAKKNNANGEPSPVTPDDKSNGITEGATVIPRGNSNADDGSVAVTPSPSPLPSPVPPSFPAPTPTLSPARIREDADISSLIPETLRTDAFLAEWPLWVDHCRTHADHRTKAYTKFTVRQQLGELERMGPEKALRALQVSGQRGSASIIDPDEQRFGKVNGSGHSPTKPRAPTADIRAGIDPAAFLAFFRNKYPRLRPDFSLSTATAEQIHEYRTEAL